jgi:hypothetical protein
MPSFFNQREHGRFHRRDPRVELHHGARLHLALVVRRLVLVVRLAQDASVARSARPIGSMTCGVKRSFVTSSR